jgi:hypothetical protein
MTIFYSIGLVRLPWHEYILGNKDACLFGCYVLMYITDGAPIIHYSSGLCVSRDSLLLYILSLSFWFFFYMDGQKESVQLDCVYNSPSVDIERESFTISFCFVSLCPMTVELIISSTWAVSSPFLWSSLSLDSWGDGRRGGDILCWEEKNQFFIDDKSR